MDGTDLPALPRRWRAGALVFDERGDLLTVNERARPIEPIPRRLLHRLLRSGGEIVPKDELIASAWRSTRALSEASFYTAMKRLRTTLGEDGSTLIALEPGRGYRITALVTVEPSPAPARPLLTLVAGDSVPGKARWRLVQPLGEAGRRDVWLATHDFSEERRVFKFAEDEARRAALAREVLSARRLRDAASMQDGFVAVLDAALEARPAYLELEYGGRDLTEWAASAGGIAAVPLELRLRLVAEAAALVAAAHEVGVLHGDLKPSNLLVDKDTGEPRIRLIDFEAGGIGDPAGLGALSRSLQHFDWTEAGRPLGTLPYAAPEVLVEGRPTTAGDIYALGVLLYQMAAGDLGRPLTAGWEHDIGDPLLRDDIAVAACGDPARRLGAAQMLAERLRALPARRAAAEQVEAARRGHQALEQEAREAVMRAQHAGALARRTRIAALGLLLLCILAVTLALAAHEAQRTASAERALARRASAAARDAVGHLIDDVVLDMRDRENISQEALKRSLGRAEEIVTRLSDLDPADRALSRLEAHALVQFAPVYKHQGDLAEAQQAAERAATLALGLSKADSADADAGLTRARALRWVGDVKLQRRDFAGSGAAYREARDLMAALALSHPHDETIQLVVARSEEQVGDWYYAQGRNEEALASYRRAEGIMAAGDGEFGKDPEWKMDASVSLEKIADALSSLGDHEKALDAYSRELAIRQSLLAADDHNARYTRNVSVALDDVASEAIALRDTAKATHAYKDALALDQRLLAADPTNLRYREDLLITASHLADTEVALGDNVASIRHRDLAIRSAHELLARSPDDRGFREEATEAELAAARGMVRLGLAAEAKSHAIVARDLGRQLAAERPGELAIREEVVEAERLASAKTTQQSPPPPAGSH